MTGGLVQKQMAAGGDDGLALLEVLRVVAFSGHRVDAGVIQNRAQVVQPRCPVPWSVAAGFQLLPAVWIVLEHAHHFDVRIVEHHAQPTRRVGMLGPPLNHA